MRALLQAFLHDPRPGLLLAGDPSLQEERLRQLIQALRTRWPVMLLPRQAGPAELWGRPDPLAALAGGTAWRPGLLEREGVLVIPAAHLLEPAVAAAATRAERLLAAAPDLSHLHPALQQRLAAVLSLPEGPPPEGGSSAAPDPAELVSWFQRWGVAGHGLEVNAALLAAALAATGGPVQPCLERYLLAPRAASPPAEAGAPPPEAAAHQPRATSDAPAAPEHAPEQPPEPPAPAPSQSLSPPPKARARRPAEGRRGPVAPGAHRGRVYRTGPTPARQGSSLALLATLLAAAPWQAQRGRTARGRLHLRPEDLRWAIKRRRCGQLTILVVDGSGSMAQRAIRLAKSIALGLLQEAYRNRNRVAIVLARGRSATLALPPTRAVDRARSCLGALPTGGGTPLASALLLAARLAARAEPATSRAILLTDGRANVGLGGDPRADGLQALALLRQRVASVELADLSPKYGAGRGAAWLAEHLGPGTGHQCGPSGRTGRVSSSSSSSSPSG